MTSYLFCVIVIIACWYVIPLTYGLTPTTKHKGCLYGGRVVLPRVRFKPDPCTSCRCPRKGDQAVCTVEDCRKDLHCLRHSNMTSRRSCCRKCVEYGCRHTDGHVYQRGEVISSEECAHCYCPLKGGASACDVRPCPPIMCVDFVLPRRKGRCCPRCPRGQNCQLGLRTISRGRIVTSGGALCQCRLLRRGRNYKLEAVCFDRKSAKFARLMKRLNEKKKKN
ncbi:hypothetical protein ACOMHN_046672 [Nucella lapillus]